MTPAPRVVKEIMVQSNEAHEQNLSRTVAGACHCWISSTVHEATATSRHEVRSQAGLGLRLQWWIHISMSWYMDKVQEESWPHENIARGEAPSITLPKLIQSLLAWREIIKFNAVHKINNQERKLRQDKLTLIDSAGSCRSFRMSRTSSAASTAILSPSNSWKVPSCCVKYTSRSASPSRLAHLHSDGHSDGQSADRVST